MSAVIINYWAVLVAAIASFVIGGLWYSPVLFGKKWMELMNVSEKEMKGKKKETTKSYVIGFLSTVMMAYVLAHLVDYTSATTALGGAQAGFWAWLGFVAMVQLGMVLWGGKPWAFYFLNTAYYLVSMVVMGIILAVWA